MGSQVMWGSAGQTRVFFLPLGVCEKHTDGYGRSSVSSSGFFSLSSSPLKLCRGGGSLFSSIPRALLQLLPKICVCMYVSRNVRCSAAYLPMYRADHPTW